MRMSLSDGLLLVLLSVLWGGAFFFAAIAVKEIPPLTVVLLRVAIAASALALFLRVREKSWSVRRPPGSIVTAFLVMGLFNNFIPFSLLFWAQTSISSGLASVLNATTPIFAVVFSHILLVDERMGWAKLSGVILGVLGVAVLVGLDAMTGVDVATLGMAACLGAACSYGLASVYGRRFRKMGMPNTVVAFGQLAATTAMMLPVALIVDRPWALPMPGVGAVAAVIALALVSTALAYIIFFRILGSAGAVNISLVTLLIPVSAIVLGAVFLGERLEPRHYAGMTLIAIGLVALDGRLLRPLRQWLDAKP